MKTRLLSFSKLGTPNDLHILMMSKRNDPWSGETTYKVTNIQLAEPDPSLFAVPAGYTVR